jgi:ribonuclease R
VPRRPPRPRDRHARGAAADTLPSESEILAFVANAPGRIGKRDIARAFGIKGNAKLALKHLLKTAERKGVLSRQGKKLQADGTLPSVTLVEVTAINEDGDVIAFPVDWDEGRFGARPEVLLRNSAPAAPGIGDRVLVKVEKLPSGYFGQLLRVDRPPPERIVGVYHKRAAGGGWVSAASRKDRFEYSVAHGDESGAADGALVSAEVLRRASRGQAQARIRTRLGASDDPRNTSLIAIQSHGIPVDFPDAVKKDVAALTPFRRGERDDLRHLPLITIDPADARDHDDAIWAEPDNDPSNPGGHKLTIAIADVAAYVTPQSTIDREARRRGNSVYFPDRVVPMLPERLSNDLCSLKEEVDRPALICQLIIDGNGGTRTRRFTRAVIRIAAGLAYEDAQAAIDGGGSAKARAMLAPALLPLWKAYEVLCKARDKRGPLALELPERKIILDEKGRFAGIRVPLRLEAHRLVEEFMIRANVAAAEVLNDKRTPLLFRIHGEPSAEKLRSLSDFLRTVQIPFALGQVMRAKTFNRILAAAKGTAQERLVHEVVLRSQAQALYAPKNAGHFGLGLANYAHFTSPIRRYADLIVHRALISALRLGSDGLSPADVSQLDETAELISAAERRAMVAERETVDRLAAAFLAGRLGATFSGRISGVVSAGLFVVLDETGADGFLPVSSLGHERFELHQARHALIGARSGKAYQLGDPIKVRLIEVAPLKGGLKFELANQDVQGTLPGKKKPHRRSRR